MGINNITADLVSELDYISGSECPNPNSYDGYLDRKRREFRYPVVVSKHGTDVKKIAYNTRQKLLQSYFYDIKPEYFKTQNINLVQINYMFASQYKRHFHLLKKDII